MHVHIIHALTTYNLLLGRIQGSKAKHGHATTMLIYSILIEATRGESPVLSTALEYMGTVLACPCLALEAQIFQVYLYYLGKWDPVAATMKPAKLEFPS